MMVNHANPTVSPAIHPNVTPRIVASLSRLICLISSADISSLYIITHLPTQYSIDDKYLLLHPP